MGDERIFGDVRQAIERVALPLGFAACDPDLWTRQVGWKTDRIELIRRRTGKQTFFINLHVVLPPTPDSGLEFASLGFINLPATSGHHDTAYYLKDRSGIDRIAADLTKLPEWFTHFDTPSKCLEYLKHKSGKSPDAPVYKHCFSYLFALL